MAHLLHVRVLSSLNFYFLIIFIYFIFHNLSPSLCDTEKGYLDCFGPFQCSNTSQNLTYPFWGSTRPRHCGHPRFELNCSGEAPVLSIISTNYRIIGIDYSSQALRVVRMDYWNSICPASVSNSTMDFTLFNYTDDTYTLLLFYDCFTTSFQSSKIFFSQTQFTDQPMNCNKEDCSNSNANCDKSPGNPNNPYKMLPDCSQSATCRQSPGNPNNPKMLPDCSKSNSNRARATVNATVNTTANGTDSNNFGFSCSNRVISAGFYELINTTNLSSWRGIRRCNTSVILPIFKSVAEKIGNNSTPSYLVTALRAGFGLRWHLDNSTCGNCRVSGGACGSNPTSGEFTCYCKTGSYPFECGKASSSKSTWWIRVVIGIFIALAVLIIIVISIYYYRKKRVFSNQIEEIIRTYHSQIPVRYHYNEVKKMTKLFKEKIGRGGCSTVYKGKLSNGKEIAVKLLNKSKGGDMREFMNEVSCISKTSHVNVVTLLGFCFEWNKRVLIYEFMPKGSLEKYTYRRGLSSNDCKLDWDTLYKIVLGIARGLEYLHLGCNTQILHFDIKPHNILLDEDFCPKISDFGLSKQCKIKESHVSMTNPRGTPGFIAPEVYSRSLARVTHKSDVYSFGMLILELVDERKCPNEDLSEKSEEYFPDWIYNDLQQNKDMNVYWATMTKEEEEIARKLIIVSLRCIQTIPSTRPSMSEVIEMLGRSLDRLQIPPKPSLLLVESSH